MTNKKAPHAVGDEVMVSRDGVPYITKVKATDTLPVDYYKGQTNKMQEREIEFTDEWFKEHKGKPTYADAIAWAERETIYKACEWLRMNMTDTVYISTNGSQNLFKVDFINKFYEAMREG